MIKSTKKALSLTFALIMSLSTLSPHISNIANAASKFQFVGQDSNVTSNIMLGNIDTGADYTRVHLGSGGASGYGANEYINIIEANLNNNPKLTFEVINNGQYIKDAVQLDKQIKNYSEDDKKVIAAVNGDWMSDVNSIGASVSNNYRVSFSPIVIDEEIWCSQMTDKEQAADYYTFGVTTDNEVVIGKPYVNVKVKNTSVSNSKSIATTGLNRAPSNNALVVYNNRLNAANYVSSDAYEVVIKTTSTNKFYHDEKVIGTVSKIYPSGTTSRCNLDDNTIILTARGSEISKIKDKFSIGDTVEITAKIGCNTNNREWKKCEEAIGGQCLVMKDGSINNTLAGSTMGDYPTSIIGYKSDGTVMLTMVTADQDGVRKGLNFANEIAEFCKDIGYDTCFLFDGGGSTTMLTMESNSLKVRSCHADGNIRSVWNSLALVYDSTPDVVATATPTAKPTARPTSTPTATPTSTPKPTANATTKPTTTVKPTATATIDNTLEPTIVPTATQTPSSTEEAAATVAPTEEPIETNAATDKPIPTETSQAQSEEDNDDFKDFTTKTIIIIVIAIGAVLVVGIIIFVLLYLRKH